MGVVWPILYWPRAVLYNRPTLSFCWAIACLVTGIFPLLSVEKKEKLSVMYVSKLRWPIPRVEDSSDYLVGLVCLSQGQRLLLQLCEGA
jgi:hypothetical protein